MSRAQPQPTQPVASPQQAQQPDQSDDLSQTSPALDNSSTPGLGVWDTGEQMQQPDSNLVALDPTGHYKFEQAGLSALQGMSSKFNITYDIAQGDAESNILPGAPFGLVPNLNETQQQVDFRKNLSKSFQESLQNKINALPQDSKHWYTQTAPRLLGSLIDPITLAVGGGTETGLSALGKFVPSAVKVGADSSLVARAAVGAIKGGAAGVTAGAATGAVAAITNPDISLNDYLSNTLNWGVMGTGAGFLGPIAGDIFKGVKSSLIDKVRANPDISAAEAPTVNPDTAEVMADVAHMQITAGKKVNIKTIAQAEKNRAIQAFNDKQAYYDSLSDSEKSELPSPMEQLKAVSDQAQSNINDSHAKISSMLDDMETKYEGINSSQMREQIRSAPVPTLMDTMLKSDAAQSFNVDPRLKKLASAIKFETPTAVEPYRTINNAMNKSLLEISPQESDLIQNMHNPSFEYDQIQQLQDRELSDGNKSKLNNRAAALLKTDANAAAFDENKPLAGLGKLLNDQDRAFSNSELPNLNDAIEELATNVQNKRIIDANIDSITDSQQDLSDLIPDLAHSLSDPANDFDAEEGLEPINQSSKVDAPYSTTPDDLKQLDDEIAEKVKAGDMDESDLEEVRRVDEAEQDDKGQKSFLNLFKACFLRNGL